MDVVGRMTKTDALGKHYFVFSTAYRSVTCILSHCGTIIYAQKGAPRHWTHGVRFSIRSSRRNVFTFFIG